MTKDAIYQSIHVFKDQFPATKNRFDSCSFICGETHLSDRLLLCQQHSEDYFEVSPNRSLRPASHLPVKGARIIQISDATAMAVCRNSSFFLKFLPSNRLGFGFFARADIASVGELSFSTFFKLSHLYFVLHVKFDTRVTFETSLNC